MIVLLKGCVCSCCHQATCGFTWRGWVILGFIISPPPKYEDDWTFKGRGSSLHCLQLCVWLIIPKLMLPSATSLLVHTNLTKSLGTRVSKKCSHLASYLPSQFPECSLPSAAAFQNNWRKNDSKENKDCAVKRIKAISDWISVIKSTRQVCWIWFLLMKSFKVAQAPLKVRAALFFSSHKDPVTFLWRDVTPWLTWVTGNSLAGSSSGCIQEGGAGASFMLGAIYSHPETPSQLCSDSVFDFCCAFYTIWPHTFPLSLHVVVVFTLDFELNYFPFLVLCSVRTFSGCQSLFGAITIATDHASVSLLLPSLSFFRQRTRKRFAEAPRLWQLCRPQPDWSFLRRRMMFSLNSVASQGS